MTLHVFGAILTAHGTAANNRGITEGNVATLQKLIWNGQVHTTVSAESIRFALRRRLAEYEACNRTYEEATRGNSWADPTFARWTKNSRESPFVDDDLLGFMHAEGAKQEGDKGSARIRRAVLEVTRAVSLAAWPGDVTFNAASPGATPSAQKRGGTNPVPYHAEMHATRYQYGFALTPERLRIPRRAEFALEALCTLGEVAGNHARFLFDFSPESIVFRLTDDPAPRVLYAFNLIEGGRVGIADLVRKARAGDVVPSELIVGGAIVDEMSPVDRSVFGASSLHSGVRAACAIACTEIARRLT